MIGEMTDEVVVWEVNQQINLRNAIFSQVVNHHVQKLRNRSSQSTKTRLYHDERGRKLDHLRSRSHRTRTRARNTMETIQRSDPNHETRSSRTHTPTLSKTLKSI